MQLVIAEKPSVAQSIAKVLGADERKDGYMEGNGSIVYGAWGIWLSWHSRMPILMHGKSGLTRACL